MCKSKEQYAELLAEHVKQLSSKQHHDRKRWGDRYRSINDPERHLYVNGTRIIKFFLHLSKEEQRKRFLARIDEPDRNWKFSSGDIQERQSWPQYTKADEKFLSATSTQLVPRYVARHHTAASKPGLEVWPVGCPAQLVLQAFLRTNARPRTDYRGSKAEYALTVDAGCGG